jgi:hypothetical protein
MPRPKSPKKNVGTEESVLNTDSPVSKPDRRVAASPNAAPEGRNNEMKTIASNKTRKPEIVKAEPRSNLVPINLEDEIRRLAYLLSERRGFEPGHETEDWLSAEREVLDRYHQQTA